MKPMEITIPAESSEVTLKTGGKYCNKDIVVKQSFRVETVTFTPTADTASYSLDITPNAKRIEIIPTNRVDISNNPPTDGYPLDYVYFEGSIGVWCRYYYASKTKFAMSMYTDGYDTSNGFTINLQVGEEIFWVFKANEEYTVRAYYWD